MHPLHFNSVWRLQNFNYCTIFMTLELKALLRLCSNWTHGHWLVRSFLAQRLFNPRKTIGYEYFSVASDRFRDSHKICHSEVLVALCLSVSKISFIGATSSSQRLHLLFLVGYFLWISIPETKLCHNKLFWRNHFLKSCLKKQHVLTLDQPSQLVFETARVLTLGQCGTTWYIRPSPSTL